MGEELLADEPGVRLDGVAGVGGDDVPGQQVVLVQAAQQRRELRHLVRLRPDEPFGEHGPGAVDGGGQQVRDEPVRAGRAAHRLAVHCDRGQPARPGQGERDRTGVRAARQVRPGMAGQCLRAQRGEDAHHGVRVRRHERPRRVPAGAGRGQDLLRRGVHPRGHVLRLRVPAQHRRRAQGQHARQRVPDPARVARIRDRREALQQVPARRRVQRGGTGGQLAEGFPGSGRHRHARLNGQRGLPVRRRDFSNPLS